jgi:chlorite dismutase
MSENNFDFIGGNEGQWKILAITAVIGTPLELTSHLKITASTNIQNNSGLWTLKGFRSNIRYSEKIEKEQLNAIQAELDRPEATRGALIPIKKSAIWWTLAQDERRKIFEEQSHHTKIGLKYLPAIARRLYHCRDIGEPFDFLTWFEYAPKDSELFEELVNNLRKTEEWNYVEREIDIRLIRL